MSPEPYSIRIRSRPVKVAFFINPSDDLAWDQVGWAVGHNQERWGGRFNPIILSDGRTLGGAWRTILDRADPDIIHSFTALSPELVSDIDEHFSPYVIRMPAPNTGRLQPYVDDSGLLFRPTLTNLNKRFGELTSAARYASFDIERAPAEIQRFIAWNFGNTFGPAAEHELGSERIFKATVTDRQSLAATLDSLARSPHVIHPIQLCAYPNNTRYIHWNDEAEAFTVVVGDTLHDLAWFWDRTSFVPNWRRSRPHQIWTPGAFIRDVAFKTALRNYIHQQALTSPQNRVDFVSLSVSEAELRAIANEVTERTGARVTIRASVDPLIPTTPPHAPLAFSAYGELYRGRGNTEELVINEPDIAISPSDEHWMSDIAIEHRSETRPKGGIPDLWWQLPNRNHLAHIFTRRCARITSDGLISVPVRSSTRQISFKIPSDDTPLRALLIGGTNFCYNSDARSTGSPKGFKDVRYSDKGRYLSGFVDIFGGLTNAQHYLEQPYWRRMFRLLSNVKPETDNAKLTAVENKLARATARHGAYIETPEGRQWLARYVLKLARESGRIGRELPYTTFLAEAQRELANYNAAQHLDPPQVLEEALLKGAISRLLQLGVLMMGVRGRCRSCGQTNWYEIDDARQTVDCHGCGRRVNIQPESEWYYKLNTLVESGVTDHGLVPVALALAHLLDEAGTSFVWSPSLELRASFGGNCIGDIDVACIRDGRFIVGEVKQSVGLFKPSDFEGMVTLARTARPNEVIFSSLDSPNSTVVRELEMIKNALTPLGIKTYWLQLSNLCFEPSPPH